MIVISCVERHSVQDDLEGGVPNNVEAWCHQIATRGNVLSRLCLLVTRAAPLELPARGQCTNTELLDAREVFPCHFSYGHLAAS